jgi:hypothetical protein
MTPAAVIMAVFDTMSRFLLFLSYGGKQLDVTDRIKYLFYQMVKNTTTIQGRVISYPIAYIKAGHSEIERDDYA